MSGNWFETVYRYKLLKTVNVVTGGIYYGA